MIVFETEKAFEQTLLKVQEFVNKKARWNAFKGYLGDGKFLYVVVRGNPRTSHTKHEVVFKVEGSEIVVDSQECVYSIMSESYSYQWETKADIFQEKMDRLFKFPFYPPTTKAPKIEYKGKGLWDQIPESNYVSLTHEMIKDLLR